MSKLQDLQRQRAFFKYVVMGLNKRPMLGCMSKEEYAKWSQIINLHRELIEMHDQVSKEMGLKVPEYRCWCGKEGKYPSGRIYPDGENWVCKKHLED